MKTNSNLNLSTYRKPNGVRTSGATSIYNLQRKASKLGMSLVPSA